MSSAVGRLACHARTCDGINPFIRLFNYSISPLLCRNETPSVTVFSSLLCPSVPLLRSAHSPPIARPNRCIASLSHVGDDSITAQRASPQRSILILPAIVWQSVTATLGGLLLMELTVRQTDELSLCPVPHASC